MLYSRRGDYRYFPGGNEPFCGFLFPMGDISMPVFHVESGCMVQYRSHGVARYHRALVVGMSHC